MNRIAASMDNPCGAPRTSLLYREELPRSCELVRGQSESGSPPNPHVSKLRGRASPNREILSRDSQILPKHSPNFNSCGRDSSRGRQVDRPSDQTGKGGIDQYTGDGQFAVQGSVPRDQLLPSQDDEGGWNERPVSEKLDKHPGPGPLSGNPVAPAADPHTAELDSPSAEKRPVAAIYARVSTSDQSTQPQIEALLQEAARLGLSVSPERVYVDDGVSGSLTTRPAFDRLRAMIQAREICAVLVTKLDRLGRNARGVLEFYDIAESSGVRIIVTDQGIDTGTPVGRLTRTFLLGMAEFERDLIRERTQAAMDARKAGMPTRSGRPVGRPKRVTSEKVEEAIRLRSLTPPTAWAVVAQKVGLPKETIRRAVREALRKLPALAHPTEGAGKSPDSV